MPQADKRAMYAEVRRELAALLKKPSDPVTVMATTVAVLHHANARASWTGFYRVAEPELLRIGPYQGSLGCLEISFARGVCGAAARLEQTQVVPDVHEFPGHIACDSRARSEIVVPIHNQDGVLVAVLDIDSHEPSAFDQVDREELEHVATMLATHL